MKTMKIKTVKQVTKAAAGTSKVYLTPEGKKWLSTNQKERVNV